jgi:hypothetical protein
VFIAAVVYGYGHPHFDGYRPAAIDRPLQSFYSEVNVVTRDGKRVLDNWVTMRYVKNYMDRVGAQFTFDR